MPIQHECGYVIPAINTAEIDYVTCAQVLRESILDHHPHAHVTIITADMLPYGEQGGFANDWQCWSVSPYRQTIKLEADMIAAGPIDHWWTLFGAKDVVISTGARDFYDQITSCRIYRKIFDDNGLPDVYNAITYWRVSRTAQEFFQWVKHIFYDWTNFKTLLKFPDKQPSTDVVYAMAAQIMGVEQVTLPSGLGPQIVHMKQGVIPTHTRDWTRELIWEPNPLRINTVVQWGLVHYNNKFWPREYISVS